MMSKKTVWVLVVFLLALALAYVNFFVYPFQSSRPNYSDVSAEFDKIVFPQDWQITKIIENKGIAGRACPIEGSGCFSKQVFMSLPAGVGKDTVELFLKNSVCDGLNNIKKNNIKDMESLTLSCVLSNDLIVGSDYDSKNNELYISVSTP